MTEPQPRIWPWVIVQFVLAVALGIGAGAAILALVR